MRIALAAAAVVALALAAAGCGGKKTTTHDDRATAQSADACAKNNLPVVTAGKLTVGHRQSGVPDPWFGGGTKSGSKWKINDPSTGKGFESAVAYAVAKQLGFTPAAVVWKYVPFSTSYAPGTKPFDFDINEISYTAARAKAVDFSDSYYDVNQSVVVNKGTKIASVTTVAGLKPFKLGAQLGTTSYNTIVKQIAPSQKPSVFPKNPNAVQALKNKQIDGLVVDLPTAFYVTAVQVPNSKVLGQFPTPAGGEHFGLVLAKHSALTACVNRALTALRSERDPGADPAAVALEGDRGPGPEVDGRRSRLLDSRLLGGEGGRSVVVATVSTIVFFVLVVVLVTQAPGWPEVQSEFFNWQVFRSSLPEIARAFLLNVKIFMVAEVLILAFALLLAVIRSLPGPVFFPLRAMAIVYADFFRGVPTILVISVLGFGAPALQLQGVPKSVIFWGTVSLVLVYSAYVSEVYRAGIESVHPSQEAAARSLGLSRLQTLRRVILPQAVRRVIPPLLNDFIGLQKDTALVGTLGRDRGLQPGEHRRGGDLQLHARTSPPRCSSSRSRSRSPGSRTG